MRRIDTHTHAWGADTAERPWAAEVLPPGWTGAYTHDDLVSDMDAAAVDEAVVVTTPLYGRGAGANEYTLRSIAAHPDRLWGVGIMDFFADDAPDRLRTLVSHDRLLGVRMHAALSYDPIPTDVDRESEWILDDRLAPVWAVAAESDACVYLFPKAQQLGAVERVAERYPDVTLVVDHMAWPDETTTPDDPPWTDFRALARHDNTYVKVSSLPRSSDEGWPYRDLHPYVRNLVAWFGADRLMLGSDYPWMDDWATYDQCLSWLDECDGLSTADRAFLRYRTFRDLHG